MNLWIIVTVGLVLYIILDKTLPKEEKTDTPQKAIRNRRNMFSPDGSMMKRMKRASESKDKSVREAPANRAIAERYAEAMGNKKKNL